LDEVSGGFRGLDIEELKKKITGEISASHPELSDLSRELHANPEIAFEERRSSGLLADFLQNQGFTVEKGICQLPTAFKASYGHGAPIIAFLAEYDALPKLGHACGHNLIATSAVAAGLAARLAVDALGGSVAVYGTPGEELYGGKAIMAERGAFDEVGIAMIAHPGGGNRVAMSTLASETLQVQFHGVASHAGARPEAGINALEAMIQSYNAINSLRQHITAGARVSGVITDGGEAANIVPAHTAATFIVRGENDRCLEDLKEKVINCFAGAATATGAKLEYEWGEHYAAMVTNMALAGVFERNMRELGRIIPLGDNTTMNFSTDVGNVSQLLPTIQPLVGIAPGDVSIHTPAFTEAAASEEALDYLLDAAAAMAMTTADLLADPKKYEEIQAEFRQGNSP
jgi:amidohydrolase